MKWFGLFLVFLLACAQQVENTQTSGVVEQPEPFMSGEGEVSEVASEVAEAEVAMSAKTVEVKIEGFAFVPADITIKAGDTVTWTNLDKVQHTATSTSAPESFDSGLLKQGESWSFTFTTPGVYAYDCTPHPRMIGMVTVE